MSKLSIILHTVFCSTALGLNVYAVFTDNWSLTVGQSLLVCPLA